jgi:hypothetical protein
MPRLRLSALPLLAVLALAGCAAEAGAPDESAPATAQQVGSVSTIDDLVEAYTAAGGVCSWTQTDAITRAAASGTCRTADTSTCDTATDWAVLSVYASTSARDEIAENIRTGDCPTSLLVGENWILNASDAPAVAVTLGGELYRNGAVTGPIPGFRCRRR